MTEHYPRRSRATPDELARSIQQRAGRLQAGICAYLLEGSEGAVGIAADIQHDAMMPTGLRSVSAELLTWHEQPDRGSFKDYLAAGRELEAPVADPGGSPISDPAACRRALADLRALHQQARARQILLAAAADERADGWRRAAAKLRDLEAQEEGQDVIQITAERAAELSADVIADALDPEQRYLPTGFLYLDYGLGYYDPSDKRGKSGGLYRGHLNLLLARLGVGKTNFALNIIANHLLRGTGTPIVFYTREMSVIEVWRRLMLMTSAVPYGKYHGGAVSVPVFAEPKCEPERDLDAYCDLQAFAEGTAASVMALKRLSDMCSVTPVTLVPGNAMDIDDLTRDIESRAARGAQLVIIDYVQDIRSSESMQDADMRLQHVAISQQLKRVAQACPNMALLGLAQAKRLEARGAIMPDAADIAESDQYGRDAALVLGLSTVERPEDWEKQWGKCHQLCLRVLKNRDGRAYIDEHMYQMGWTFRYVEYGGFMAPPETGTKKRGGK